MQVASLLGAEDSASKLCVPQYFYVDHLQKRRQALASKSIDDVIFQETRNSSMDAEADGLSPGELLDEAALFVLSAQQEDNFSLSKISEDRNSDEQTDAGESMEEEKKDEEEDQEADEAYPDSPKNEHRYPTDGGFSVTVATLAGEQLEIKGLYADMHARELAFRVAAETGIPPFAVALNHDGQLLTMDSNMLLQECCIVDGSEVLLVKQWGWGKPDLRLLSELHAKWGGSKLSIKSD
eukprot:TRINITY_DN58387_c0_g1_i1.p1 TRINITY_DN58387_c0_g1~~TRINITY_DN58387_c0_g1_i1.p1  ORF type:complete len:238 (+),score=65.26 TRINITY_DN58387_c0_g1_i1:30-743(+)